MICTWAHVSESTREQYSAYVSKTAAQLCTRAWHFHIDTNPSLEFENPPWANAFTIFESPKLDATIDPSDLLLDIARQAPEPIRVDVRQYEDLQKSFQQDHWAGSYDELNFLVVGTLHLRDAAIFEEYFDWTEAELAPNVLSTDEFLRARYFKTTDTRLTESTTPIQRLECANTLVLFELNSEDFLWDKFLDIATSQRWLRMEPDLKFEMNKWYLQRCFGSGGQLLPTKAVPSNE